MGSKPTRCMHKFINKKKENTHKKMEKQTNLNLMHSTILYNPYQCSGKFDWQKLINKFMDLKQQLQSNTDIDNIQYIPKFYYEFICC